LIHALFSTRDRRPWLSAEVRQEVFRYLGGTVNELGGQSLLVNGPCDHVHMLFVQPPTLSLATLIGKMKSNSSGWVKRRWQDHRHFGWQTGYAAFSVSKSQVEQLKLYILNQEGHYRRVSFQEEVIGFWRNRGWRTTQDTFSPENNQMPPLTGLKKSAADLPFPHGFVP
jgi:putative transposase